MGADVNHRPARTRKRARARLVQPRGRLQTAAREQMPPWVAVYSAGRPSC